MDSFCLFGDGPKHTKGRPKEFIVNVGSCRQKETLRLKPTETYRDRRSHVKPLLSDRSDGGACKHKDRAVSDALRADDGPRRGPKAPRLY
ncbi:hypothetical protein M514_04803 [Trichuris suis]|uniref:Uncharacterized protein n=1 Tax=Trichuris suis TaxID=68888 RepID=A0A085NUN9_9BILA|nr:hypothetical protein M514_04803 [Trichuris suis]